MKKLKLILALGLMMLSLGAQTVKADDVIYATLADGTMTIYYDSQKDSRSGVLAEWNASTGMRDVAEETRMAVLTVILDASMKNARPESTKYWFFMLSNLQDIQGLTYLNTSEVTTMYHMFFLCSKLKSLDVSHFNTSNVTNMQYMFSNCQSLSEILVDNFDVSKADISYMFQECRNLKTIYCTQNWSGRKGTNMFSQCESLQGGNGTVWSEASRMDSYFARLDGLNGKAGYFTAPPAEVIAAAKENLKNIIDLADGASEMLQVMGETAAAEEISNAATEAQAVYDKENASMAEINAATAALDAALVRQKEPVLLATNEVNGSALDNLLEEGDSEECKKIVADAKEALSQLYTSTWDDTKSFMENFLAMQMEAQGIMMQLVADLEAQREKEQSGDGDDIAAAKQELNQWMLVIGMVYQVYDMTGDADGYAEMEALLVDANVIDLKEDATLAEINAQIATLKEAANAHKAEVILYHQLLGEEELDALLEEGDSEECQKIIADAKDALNAALVWNDEIAYIENIDALTEAFGLIYDQAVLDLAAQRAKEQSGGGDDIAAAKQELEQWMFAIGLVYQLYDMTGDADGYAEMEALLVDANVIDLKEDATLAEINAQIATLKEAANAHKAEVILYHQILGAEELDALLVEGDSEECQKIIADAKDALNAALVWNDEIAYIENIDALAEAFVLIYDQAVLDLAAQRAGEHATGIDTVESQQKVESRKLMRNGILYIQHGAKTYNVLGAEVK